MADEKKKTEVTKEDAKFRILPGAEEHDAPHGIDEEGNVVGSDPPRKAKEDQ